MERIVRFAITCLFCAAATGAFAQVTPSAYRGQVSLTVGGMGSVFQPDYAGGGVPGSSPQRLFGWGGYVDLKLTHWIQLEGEARWLRGNPYLDIREDNYLVGPRVPIHEYKYKNLALTPYGKALVGMGRMNFEYDQAYGHFTDVALGGGVDVQVTKKISVRAFDFEYQLWPNWINGTLKPYGGSIGIGYKIF